MINCDLDQLHMYMNVLISLRRNPSSSIRRSHSHCFSSTDFTETDVENTSGYGAGLQHTELSQNTASSSEAAGNDCTVTLTPKRLKERLIDFKQKVGPLATSCGRR